MGSPMGIYSRELRDIFFWSLIIISTFLISIFHHVADGKITLSPQNNFNLKQVIHMLRAQTHEIFYFLVPILLC